MFPWNLFPFNKEAKNMMQHIKPEEIQKYVEDMMTKMNPSNFNNLTKDNINPGFASENTKNNHNSLVTSVFETHDFVFVRIPIKNEEWIKNLKLYYTSNQLIIEHIPQFEDKHTVILPAVVKKKGSSATYKDEMLEIKILKNIDMQYSEINVTEN